MEQKRKREERNGDDRVFRVSGEDAYGRLP
jgi:hypothetical protein